MLLLIALLAPETITGYPGEGLSFGATVLGASEAQLSASEPLVVEQTVGRGSVNVSARIAKGARPGTYEAYLYAAPVSEDEIVGAAASRVHVTVRNNNATHLLTTASTFAKTRWWLVPALAASALLLAWAVGLYEVRLA